MTFSVIPNSPILHGLHRVVLSEGCKYESECDVGKESAENMISQTSRTRTQDMNNFSFQGVITNSV